MRKQIYPATYNFKDDSIDFKNLSLEQKKHLKEILKKEVDYLEIVLKEVKK